jgi:hypothetical protein
MHSLSNRLERGDGACRRRTPTSGGEHTRQEDRTDDSGNGRSRDDAGPDPARATTTPNTRRQQRKHGSLRREASTSTTASPGRQRRPALRRLIDRGQTLGIGQDAEEPEQGGELGHRRLAAGAVDEVVFVLRPVGSREGTENGGGVPRGVGVEGEIRRPLHRIEALVVLPFPPSCARQAGLASNTIGAFNSTPRAP